MTYGAKAASLLRSHCVSNTLKHPFPAPLFELSCNMIKLLDNELKSMSNDWMVFRCLLERGTIFLRQTFALMVDSDVWRNLSRQ